jgi:hypothetical protein
MQLNLALPIAPGLKTSRFSCRGLPGALAAELFRLSEMFPHSVAVNTVLAALIEEWVSENM